MKTLLLISMASMALAACGRQNDSSSTAVRAAGPTLVVVSGGHASCKPDPNGLDMAAPAAELRHHDAKGLRFLLSCHDGDDTVRFVASDMQDDSSDSIDGFFRAVDAAYERFGATRLVYVGHSYGGWLAMNAALALRKAPDELVTIDPISRTDCGWATPSGCRHAPLDVDWQAVRARVGHWLNFYENDTWYLHSSPIGDADENRQLPAGHTDIDTRDEVWSEIAERVLAPT